MSRLRQVVVVGAAAAGLTAAETLRREGFSGRITMVGAESHPPYDRPPLSKQVLAGTWDPERTMLRPRPALDELGAEWQLGVPAAGLDLDAREVVLSDDRRLGYDGLVLATGARARELASARGMAGVHVLRTIEDAIGLRTALQDTTAVAVVGAGFLGAEAAAVAREMGLTVTLIDSQPVPMMRQLGPVIGAKVAELHRTQGVDVRCGTAVRGFTTAAGRVSGVQLMDGSVVPATVVLVAVGSEPAVEWLSGSGLRLGNGVETDACCAAAPSVVAAGDVASWEHAALGRRVRVEHRMNATEQGMAAARTLLGGRESYVPVSYFWSDQFGVRIQAYGRTDGDTRLELTEQDQTGFVGTYLEAARVVGAVAWNRPRAARALRHRVAEALQE